MKFRLARLSTAVMAAALVSGCMGIPAHRGAVLDDQLAAAIQAGVDNKASVERTLGRPTFTSGFGANDWYYLSRDTTLYAFRGPRVNKQTVLHVRFDQAGNVVSVQRRGGEQIVSVDPSNRKTPTLGRKRSFFEELFGNITAGGATTSTTSTPQ